MLNIKIHGLDNGIGMEEFHTKLKLEVVLFSLLAPYVMLGIG